MPNKKLPPNEVIYPWPDSAEFLSSWARWKEYKRVEWKFKYKSPISEQAALIRLAEITGGEVAVAISTINFCIANGWQGLFPEKSSTIKTITNAKQNSRNSTIDEIARSLFPDAPEQLYLGGSSDIGNDS